LARYPWTLSSTSFSCESFDKDKTFSADCSISFASHITACATAACSKSPHSRTVKRTTSGSSSSHLSCSWYGFSFPPSSPHQPVHLIPNFYFIPGPIPTLQPPLSLLPARLRAHLLLVPPTSLNAHLALWSAHHHSTLSSLCPRRVLLGAYWHVARCGKRSRRMCSRPRRMVHS
jgi:hypothetical protein